MKVLFVVTIKIKINDNVYYYFYLSKFNGYMISKSISIKIINTWVLNYAHNNAMCRSQSS